MTTEDYKPAVVNSTYQKHRKPSIYLGDSREDSLKWLKEYEQIVKFNKLNDMMWQANFYFFP